MKKKSFISYDRKDLSVVKEIASNLDKHNIWFDLYEMNAGDVISEAIETGIDQAKNFLVILSEHSILSDWVRYELNMALIKYLENEDYRIIVIRIDEVEIPLRLKHFMRIEKMSNSIAELTSSIIEELGSSSSKTFKRNFINRGLEISSIQDMIYDDEVKFINIVGFFGIGKSSLVKETLKRTYSNPSIVEINLSPAFFGARLTLELCAKAGLDIPPDGVDQEELNLLNELAIETLVSNESFILFNKVETILNDRGELNEDISAIVKRFETLDIIKKQPIFFLSTRWMNISDFDKKSFSRLNIKGVSDKHLAQIMKAEMERSNPGSKFDQKAIQKMAEVLHGYPLAAKLAAPLMIKYGPNYLIGNIDKVDQLKIDIAEEVISRSNPGEIEVKILQILAVFEKPLNVVDLSKTLEEEEFMLNEAIDNLASFNLIEAEGYGLILHPLVSNFYIKLARANKDFGLITGRLSEIAIKRLEKLSKTDANYVDWLTNACRLLFYNGKIQEGKTLRQDLLGEIKDAAISLYRKQDYKVSLTFCEDFLFSKPTDKDVLFTKARCLSRIGRENESIKVLNALVEVEENDFRLSKYKYAIGRAYIENSNKNDNYLESAEKFFIESITHNEHETALQSMGELLFRRGEKQEAAAFIERKLELSPFDPYALSLYADILWSLNRKTDAISKIQDALRHQPTNPNFRFRAGRFLLESDKLDDAYDYFVAAVDQDDNYLDARLSLADVCIDLGRLEEADEQIKTIEGKVHGDKVQVLDSIKVAFLIKKGELKEAEGISLKLVKKNRDARTLGLLAKVYKKKFQESQLKGLTLLAKTDKEKALRYLKEGLELDPENSHLKSMQHSVLEIVL